MRKLVSHDRRIGDSWMDVSHNMYRGFGGTCLPKDAAALLHTIESLAATHPAASKERKILKSAGDVIRAVIEYNKTLLESQGLTVEDVSVHDKEWIRRKLEIAKQRKTKKHG